MILKFFPQRPDHPLADGKELKRTLAELLVEKPAPAVEEVVDWFESLRKSTGFRLDQYFDVIRQLDEAAQQHLRRLAREYLMKQPLSKLEEEKLWTMNSGYWQLIAGLYLGCVEQSKLDPKGKGADAFKPFLPLAVARAQSAYYMQIKWVTYRYGPVDAEIWRRIGQTYLEAEASGHAQKGLQLYPTQRGFTSTGQIFLHAIVFFASSMDSLAPAQIELADRLITHFLPNFVLSADCRSDSLYWLDAAADSLPTRLARHPGKARPGLRFFAPGSALKSLEDLMHSVERGDVPADLNLGGEYPARAVLAVLRHLHIYWAAQPPRRRHKRHAVKTRMSVFTGFDDCYAVCLASENACVERAAALESWVVENISVGGFQACFADAPGGPARLGKIVVGRPEGSGSWLLGVARRFNRLPGSRASLGVQLVSSQAVSIKLQPRRSGFSAATGIPGVWLPSDADPPATTRIVVPLGSFNVRENLEFSYRERLHRLTPVELEESGADYEIARFNDDVV